MAVHADRFQCDFMTATGALRYLFSLVSIVFFLFSQDPCSSRASSVTKLGPEVLMNSTHLDKFRDPL